MGQRRVGENDSTSIKLFRLINNASGAILWASGVTSKNRITKTRDMGCVSSKVNDTAAQPAAQTQTAPAGPVWKQLSLNGNRKACLVGINYIGQEGELRGCINDVIKMKNYLTDEGFPADEDHMLVLTEQEDGPDWPFKERIIEGMQWLVDGAVAGDNLFFHYSGHGTRVADKSGDEKDGKDEALVPLDYSSNGLILDDEVNHLLCTGLPSGVRLTVIMDCCHSGSACDLPYAFLATKENASHWADQLPQMFLSSGWDMSAMGQLAQQAKELWTSYQGFTGTTAAKEAEAEKVDPGFRRVTENVTEASVVMISGCKDVQTSADVSDTATFKLPPECGPGGAGGACTHAFLKVIHEKPDVCFIELLEEMRQVLEEKKFEQVPMLSSSKIIALDSPFRLKA